MPSPKDPLSTVAPGPGKLPAGVVSASSFLFGGGGGGGSSAALTAHITDPLDAHMASAIGINLIDPLTGQSVLTSQGGTVDGESVLDFIVQTKDLFPDRANQLGAYSTVPNTGVPYWATLQDPADVQPGAWTNAGKAVFSHYIWQPTGSFPTGFETVLYPADRGVITLYRSTDGDFANPGTTTLYAALWLGTTANKPVALTCPDAAFDETLRDTNLQPAYTPTLIGLDQFTITERIGYRKSYAGIGVSFADFTANFNAYQVALAIPEWPAASVAGSNDSWLLIHWRETYAISDAAIAPAAIAGNFVTGNVYSQVPPNYDTPPNALVSGVEHLNRRYIFRDDLAFTAPSLASWTATVVAPTTFLLSGVPHYDNAGGSLTWNSDARVNGLAGNSWLPGSTAGAELPADFTTADNPIEYDFVDFGGGLVPLAYYQLKPTGGALYTQLAAPAVGDQVQVGPGLLSIPPSLPKAPPDGEAQLRLNMNRPWVGSSAVQGTAWTFNSWPQTAGTSSTPTFEPFRDERYRYASGTPITSLIRIEPVGLDKYDSTLVITIGDQNLQVLGDQLTYPRINFTISRSPIGPNYSAVLIGDPPDAVRIYFRVMETGLPRATGRIRVKGVSVANFTAGPFTGVLETSHPGGLALVIQVPGVSGLLDLGAPRGTPDLDMTQTLRGCQTGIVSLSPTEHIISYDTTFFTANNTFGEYPIVVGLGFLKQFGGSFLRVEEVEWLPPV